MGRAGGPAGRGGRGGGSPEAGGEQDEPACIKILE